jgi:hypothetical protein
MDEYVGEKSGQLMLLHRLLFFNVEHAKEVVLRVVFDGIREFEEVTYFGCSSSMQV